MSNDMAEDKGAVEQTHCVIDQLPPCSFSHVLLMSFVHAILVSFLFGVIWGSDVSGDKETVGCTYCVVNKLL